MSLEQRMKFKDLLNLTENITQFIKRVCYGSTISHSYIELSNGSNCNKHHAIENNNFICD
jgi:hypothetical protein